MTLLIQVLCNLRCYVLPKQRTISRDTLHLLWRTDDAKADDRDFGRGFPRYAFNVCFVTRGCLTFFREQHVLHTCVLGTFKKFQQCSASAFENWNADFGDGYKSAVATVDAWPEHIIFLVEKSGDNADGSICEQADGECFIQDDGGFFHAFIVLELSYNYFSMTFCIYCGGTTDLTKDHVPPQSFYPKVNLNKSKFWVPACKKCNNGFSHDDEFLFVHLLRGASNPHPELKERLKRAMDHQKKLSATIAAKTVFHVTSSSNTPLGVSATDMSSRDIERIHQSIARIVVGLNFILLGAPMNRRTQFTIGFIDETKARKLEDIPFPLPAPIHEIVDGTILRVKGFHVPHKASTAMWFLEFYNSKNFFVEALDPDIALKEGSLDENFTTKKRPGPDWLNYR